MSGKQKNRPLVKGITIDGPDSKDFDDAVWLERADAGGWILSVHITDVAELVRVGSKTDIQARERATSRYFAEGHSDPMLPRVVCEDKGSLIPDKVRKTVTVEIELNELLQQVSPPKIHLTRLKSQRRFVYEEVDELIKDEQLNTGLVEMLRDMSVIAQQLLDQRRLAGALAIYDIMEGWAVSEEGFMFKLRPEERHLANVIIQEFMILANQTVATFCAENDIPSLYRNHTARACAPDSAIELLDDVRNAMDNPEHFDVRTLQRRMTLLVNRAHYAPVLRGHFGLNLAAYCHFTSPIRRFADLVVHRQLKAFLTDKKMPYSKEQLLEIGEYITEVCYRERKRQRREERGLQAAEPGNDSSIKSPAEPTPEIKVDEIPVDSHKNTLLEMAQAGQISVPTFESSKVGPPHAPIFKSMVVLQAGDELIQTSGTGLKKTAAEQVAAYKALQKLEKLGVTMKAKQPILDTSGNAISRLQEHCVAQGLDVPSYNFVRGGEDHTPTWTCSCLVVGQETKATRPGKKIESKPATASEMLKLLTFSD